MKSFVLSFAMLLLLSTLLQAQEIWEKELIFNSNNWVGLTYLKNAPDGSKFSSLSGFVNNLETSESLLAKFDVDFNLEWVKRYKNFSHDRIFGLEVDSSGDIFFGSSVLSLPSEEGGFSITRLNSDGELIWHKAFDRTSNDLPLSVYQIGIDKYLAVVNTSIEEVASLVVQFNGSGSQFDFLGIYVIDQPVWLADARPISDESFLLAGDVYDPLVDRRVAVISMVEDGALVWTKTYDFGFELMENYGVSYIRVLPNGNIAVCATFLEGFAGHDHTLFVLNEEGNLLWAKRISYSPTSSIEYSLGLTADFQGNIYYSFFASSFPPISGLTKWSGDGTLIFAKAIQNNEGKVSFYEAQLDDSRLLMTGYSDIPHLSLTGINGEIACDEISIEASISDLSINVSDVNLVFVPENLLEIQTPLVITDVEASLETTCSQVLNLSNKEINSSHKVFPNPSEGIIQVEFSTPGEHSIQIFDGSGRLVQTFKTRHQVFLSGSDLAPGVYSVHIDHQYAEKIIII